MVRYEDIVERLVHRPFEPFRVVTTTGDVMDVVRRGQVAINRRWFIFARTEDRAVRLALTQLDRVDPLDQQKLAS